MNLNDIKKETLSDDNIECNKHPILINKLSEATFGLGEALLLIQSMNSEQEQLKEHIDAIQKELEHHKKYKQRIDYIKSRWYAKLPLSIYYVLRGIKRLVYRRKDKTL